MNGEMPPRTSRSGRSTAMCAGLNPCRTTRGTSAALTPAGFRITRRTFISTKCTGWRTRRRSARGSAPGSRQKNCAEGEDSLWLALPSCLGSGGSGSRRTRARNGRLGTVGGAPAVTVGPAYSIDSGR